MVVKNGRKMQFIGIVIWLHLQYFSLCKPLAVLWLCLCIAITLFPAHCKGAAASRLTGVWCWTAAMGCSFRIAVCSSAARDEHGTTMGLPSSCSVRASSSTPTSNTAALKKLLPLLLCPTLYNISKLEQKSFISNK